MVSIGVAARQTGLEISTLRKWEERYGFPRPVRLQSGQRRYLDYELKQLLIVARRVATGERPGKVIRELNDAFVSPQTFPCTESTLPQASESIEIALAALFKHNTSALRSALQTALDSRSMATFVEEIAGPMTRLVGDYWANGTLPIYGEHLYSAVLDSFLVRETNLSIGASAPPNVLLTTPPGEHHSLGLSMLNAVLGSAGIGSLRLHGGLPISEIAAATEAYGMRVVGVSVTCLYPPKILTGLMHALRNALSPDVAVWFGGAGVNQVCQIPPGVTVFSSMYDVKAACEALDLSEEKRS